MEKNENGFTEYNSSRSGSRNSSCPGTGDIWRSGENNGGTGVEGSLGGNGSCSGLQLAMVYAPHQCFRMMYSPEKALVRGTLFEELDKPLEDCVNG